MCEHCYKEDFLDIVAGNHLSVSAYKYTIDETKFDYKINFVKIIHIILACFFYFYYGKIRIFTRILGDISLDYENCETNNSEISSESVAASATLDTGKILGLISMILGFTDLVPICRALATRCL